MKIYDLSCKIAKGMWDYGDPYLPYQTKMVATLKNNGYIAHSIQIMTHTGTHLECGRHWWESGTGIDDIPLSCFIGKAVVLRFPGKDQPYSEINRQDLLSRGIEKCKNKICILHTGWGKRIHETEYTEKSPFISLDAAECMVEIGIKLLATDFPLCGDPRDGIDFVPKNLQLPDYILLKNDIPLILGLVNLSSIPDNVNFCAFPLKLMGLDGSPVRAVAWVEDNL